MKPEMFVMEITKDGRSEVGSVKNRYFDLIEEINTALKIQNYSPAELYQIMIYKGLLKPTYFREFEKIVRWGVRQGLINQNMLVSKLVKGRRLPNFFVKEQWVKFFQNCEDARTGTMCFLAFWCGFRPSEVVKLRIGDIDFERNTIKVVQGKRSKDRIVPFLPEGHEILKKWIKYSGAKDYVFYSEESHSAAIGNQPCVSQRTMRNGFVEVLKKTGLDETDDRYKKQDTPRKKYTFYVWRHSFATYWINKGISPAFIKEAMGHSKMDTTINVYSHIADKNIIEAMQKIKHKNTQEEKPALPTPTIQNNNQYSIIAERLMKGEITQEQATQLKQFITQELS